MSLRTSPVLLAFLAMPASMLVGCGESGPNLPEGWEEAELIREFTQSECMGEPPADGAIEVQGGIGTLTVTWENAAFRCEQSIEAYVRRNGVSHDILIQPVEMNPETVARCDCLYNLELGYNVSDEVSSVTLYTRPDEYGGPSSPQNIGTINLSRE